MQKNNKINGFNLVEAILASSLFGLFLTAILGALAYGNGSAIKAGERSRAIFLAEEGLEAARAIRGGGFPNLPAGTYGLEITNNNWSLTPEADITNNFKRQILITDKDASTKEISTTVSWPQKQPSNTVTLTTWLTDWLTRTTTSSSICQSDPEL